MGDDNITLRVALNILEHWKATPEQICKILSVSPSDISRTRQSEKIKLDRDQLMRISIILNCHACLRLAFDNPENVYGFVNFSNNNEFFNGRKPLEIMAQGDLHSLLETYKRINALGCK